MTNDAARLASSVAARATAYLTATAPPAQRSAGLDRLAAVVAGPRILETKPSGLRLVRFACGCECWMRRWTDGAVHLGRKVRACGASGVCGARHPYVLRMAAESLVLEATRPETVPCPSCRGRGVTWRGPMPASGDPGDVEVGPDCTRCSGAGEVPAWSIVHYAPIALQGAPTWRRVSHCERDVCIGADGVRANDDGEVYAATSSNLAHVECAECLAIARPAKRDTTPSLGTDAEQMRDAGRGHLVRGEW